MFKAFDNQGWRFNYEELNKKERKALIAADTKDLLVQVVQKPHLEDSNRCKRPIGNEFFLM